MSRDEAEPREELLRAAHGRWTASWSSADALPGTPGDLVVLPSRGDAALEWALLEIEPSGGRWLVVPADTNPLVGRADLEIGPPVGPLVLRCAFGCRVEPGRIVGASRSGSLAPEDLERARLLRRRLDRGEAASSPLGEEVETDPEYQDWIQEVVVPARRELLGAQGLAAGRSRPVPLRWSARAWPAAAAALLAVSIGLGVVSLRLQEQVESLSGPALTPAGEQVLLGGTPRSEIVVRVPGGSPRVSLRLLLAPSTRVGRGRVEIANAQGERLWSSSGITLAPLAEHWLSLPRARFPDGAYLLRLLGDRDASSSPLAEVEIMILKEAGD